VPDRVPLSQDFLSSFFMCTRLSRFHATDPRRLSRNTSGREIKMRVAPDFAASASPNVLGVANCKSRESLISSVVVDAFRPPETGSSPFRVLYHGPVIGRYKYGCEATSTSCLYNPSRPRRTGFNYNCLIDSKHVQLRVLTLSRRHSNINISIKQL